MFYRRRDGVTSSCESRGSYHAQGLLIGGLSYRVGEIRSRPLQRQLATLERVSQEAWETIMCALQRVHFFFSTAHDSHVEIGRLSPEKC